LWGMDLLAARRNKFLDLPLFATDRIKPNQVDAQPAGRAGLLARNAQNQGRTLSGRFEIRPFREQSATRDLSTTR
jgi:hypothetical protein